ncbi:MAG: hypothetical protein ABSE22_10225 [Xanthobacteraceae bacterium]|jgi:hypothetical protein
MIKNILTIAAALAIVSVGSLVSDRAQAGSSASAPSKYNHAIQSAKITEFSSSSAKTSAAHR